MSQKQNFIKTTDKEIAEKLTSIGFQLLSHNGNVYTFLNKASINFIFDEVDKQKIYYTDMLSL